MLKLTTAQALVRWLTAQRTELLDGTEAPLFPGAFAIFGHGNVLGIGSALHEYREAIPTWRGQNEQGMALAAVAYTKAVARRQVMVCTSSIGPGALNMVTAAGVAHANRLPLLLLPGDTFASRASDPVLQQLEHFDDPGRTANDAFRAVTRFFDRIGRPEQLLATLPQAVRVLTDPGDCGPVVLALPQDVQAETFDFPDTFFAPRLHRVPRPRPDVREVADAAAVLASARRPLMVVGGGVRYSGAAREALELAARRSIPVVETTAGRTLVAADHPLSAGPLGITGSSSANALAGQADVVLAVGTRLQDFTTASWTVFAPDAQLITVNTARFDAVKHGALAVVGDARETLAQLITALPAAGADPAWLQVLERERDRWTGYIDALRGDDDAVPSYAQVVGAVNDASGPDDYVMTASGGLPGELIGGWRAAATPDGSATMDVEYGFSCMGYELAGAWGAAMALPGRLVTTLLGDGSYLMANSELYSAAFAGHPFVAVVCDNDGYAVIDRLQRGQGAAAHNNMFDDVQSRTADRPRVDFVGHARSLGCTALTASTLAEFRAGYAEARAIASDTQRPVVVVLATRKDAWTESGAWWEVGVPPGLTGHADFEQGKARQVRWSDSRSSGGSAAS